MPALAISSQTLSEFKPNGVLRDLHQHTEPLTRMAFAVPDIRLEPCLDESDVVTDSSLCNALLCNLSELLARCQLTWLETEAPLPGKLVALPTRYTARMENSSDGSQVGSPEGGSESGDPEADMNTALQWIRQEIILLKQQDQSLLHQFQKLQASLLQLRHVYLSGSCSDLSSLDGSTLSLDEPARSPCLQLLSPDHSRTRHALSLPSSPRMTRFKWTGDSH